MVSISPPPSAHLEQQCRCLRHWSWTPWNSSGTPSPRAWEAQRVAAYVRCYAPTTGKASKRAEKKHPVCFPVLNPGLTSYCVHSTQTVVNPTTTVSAEWGNSPLLCHLHIYLFCLILVLRWGAGMCGLPFFPFQNSTLPVSSRSAPNFLDSTEASGRPAFPIHQIPCLPPSLMGSALFLRFSHPEFLESSLFLPSSFSKPDRLTFPSCLQYVHFPDFTSLSGFVTTVDPFSSLVHSYDYFF